MALAQRVTDYAPTCTEHDLVAAVRSGDDRAFEQLYSRYRRRIAAYVQGMVGDHARTEDITQEVFISALRRMRANDRPIAVKPWVYEIAKNACIDEFRRTRRTREVPIDGDDDWGPANPRLMSRAPTPEAAVETSQQLSDLRRAFHGLSESHHKIIVMRELEGLSYAQIAERMEMTRPVVESTLFRARRRLSEEYDELVTGRRCEQVQTVISKRSSRAVRAIGIKERRLVARHLAHCQPCRRHARLAGCEDSFIEGTGVLGKIAALLPLPAWLRFRRDGHVSRAVAARTHSLDAIQSVAGAANGSSPFPGVGRAAAAAATLLIAGAGGGLVTGLGSSPSHRPGAPASLSPGSVARSGAPSPDARGVAADQAAAIVRRTVAAVGASSPAALMRGGSVAPGAITVGQGPQTGAVAGGYVVPSSAAPGSSVGAAGPTPAGTVNSIGSSSGVITSPGGGTGSGLPLSGGGARAPSPTLPTLPSAGSAVPKVSLPLQSSGAVTAPTGTQPPTLPAAGVKAPTTPTSEVGSVPSAPVGPAINAAAEHSAAVRVVQQATSH
jgi:RNA polymerase sigma factor (sigma-70 family)